MLTRSPERIFNPNHYTGTTVNADVHDPTNDESFY